MPVVTRSQSKKNAAILPVVSNEKSYHTLKLEIHILITNFPGIVSPLQKIELLSTAIDKLEPIIDNAIQYISNDLTMNNLKFITLLHNRLLYLASEIKAYKKYEVESKVCSFTRQIVSSLESHMQIVCIMNNYRQKRISGYKLKDIYINFPPNYLYIN
jgi:hypothetical protein